MGLCFDIGGSAIKWAVLARGVPQGPVRRVATPLTDFSAFAAMVERIVTAETLPAGASIAISITGGVDPQGGVLRCANIPCIDGLRLAELLGARLVRPVLIANDADCFALAEAGIGAGRGHRVVFGAIIGTGVGGALVVDGQLHRGAGGISGEWGHGPVVATIAGPFDDAIPRFACGCGQSGCVDTVGGARGLERLHRHLHGVALSSAQIMALWERDDAAAARSVAVCIDLLAGPLALVLNVVGASIVPVGGGLANSAVFIAALDRAVRQRILRPTTEPLVVVGQCRVEPGLIGANMVQEAA